METGIHDLSGVGVLSSVQMSGTGLLGLLIKSVTTVNTTMCVMSRSSYCDLSDALALSLVKINQILIHIQSISDVSPK